ncbi:MAG: hypothetical protein AAB965_01240 [Patescibacteria group bacterium]
MNGPFLNLDSLFYLIFQIFESVKGALFSFFSSSSWNIIGGYSTLAEIILFPALIFSIYRLTQVQRKHREDFLRIFEFAKEPEKVNRQWWEDITDHIDSENEAQWKLALIDSDKILDDALREAGYVGVGVGELLKDADVKHGFKSLQDAWEAHKTRNRIAHESGFQLTKHEAKNAVERYKRAFQDLGYL